MNNKISLQIEDGKIFIPLKNKYLIQTPEEIVRQKYILKLVNHYGYDLKQMAQEVKVSNSQRGQGRAYADIVIWKTEKDKIENKKAFIVIECKAENISIKQEDYFQGFNYASWAGASFFVTTNEKASKFFNVDKDYLPKKLLEIIEIPYAKDVNNEQKIKKLLTAKKVFERDEFAKLLFACHNIIRNNDKFSPEMAFDEISKILFMKIRYERNPDEDAIFSREKFLKDHKNHENNTRPSLKGTHKDLPYIQFLFDRTKDEFKNDELFDNNETIKIKDVSFEAIVEKLEKYNLSDTSDDIKGIAFEKFLGKTFRGELGQFFTPRTIVNYIVDILDPQEGEVICDPCAGSGGFLIKTFEYIRAKIENHINQEKDKIRKEFFNENFEKLKEKDKEIITKKVNDIFNQLNEELSLKNKNSRLHKLSHFSIYGTDANPRMARTAKMNMIMHGDGHGGVHHNDGLLNINGIFENRFDIILTNPPFGSRVEKSLLLTESDKYKDEKKISLYKNLYGEKYTKALEQVNQNINKPIIDLFDLGTVSGLTEVLFMERCLKLLKKGGRMGIVLPEGVLNNSGSMQNVREYFEAKAKIILITSIPQDVFIASGATVKPSLVFFKKFTESEEKNYLEIKNEATTKINEKYKPEIEELQKQNEKFILKLKNKQAEIRTLKKEVKKDKNLSQDLDKNIVLEKELRKIVSENKKILKSKLKEIEAKKIIEIKIIVKENFNFEIPIAEIEFAGIDSKGAVCENQLIPLAKEFKDYRNKQKLWISKELETNYEIIEDKIIKKQNVNF